MTDDKVTDTNVPGFDDTVLVRYPDAPGGERVEEFEKLEEHGHYAVVYGLIPHHFAENQFHAYLVVNTVYNTVESYMASFINAVGQMFMFENTWDSVNERFGMEERETFDEEDDEAELPLELPGLGKGH